MIEFTFLAFITAISGTLLSVKAAQTGDLGILGIALSRYYLMVISILYVVSIATMVHIYWAVVVTILGDVVHFLLFEYLYTLRKRVEKIKQTTQLTDITNKLTGLMDSSTVSLFTIAMDGEIEYVNDKFSETFSTPKELLIGRNLYALFNIDAQRFETCLEAIIIYRNTRYQVSGFKSRNGHDTITGSILQR